MRILGRQVVVELNVSDGFFDGWLKQGDVESIGVNKYGVRFVQVHSDRYFCIEDVVEYAEKTGKLTSQPAYDWIYQHCSGIMSSQAKDVYKALPEWFKGDKEEMEVEK